MCCQPASSTLLDVAGPQPIHIGTSYFIDPPVHVRKVTGSGVKIAWRGDIEGIGRGPGARYLGRRQSGRRQTEGLRDDQRPLAREIIGAKAVARACKQTAMPFARGISRCEGAPATFPTDGDLAIGAGQPPGIAGQREKGETTEIGIIARNAKDRPAIAAALTPQASRT